MVPKDEMIKQLIQFGLYKLADGKQLYECTLEELSLLLKHELEIIRKRIIIYSEIGDSGLK